MNRLLPECLPDSRREETEAADRQQDTTKTGKTRTGQRKTEAASSRTVRQKTAGRTPPRRQILLSMLFSRTPYWS